MSDIARRKGIVIDAERLAAELGVPVVETVGVKATGVRALIKVLDAWRSGPRAAGCGMAAPRAPRISNTTIRSAQNLRVGGRRSARRRDHQRSRRCRRRHPCSGPLILAGILFLVFQAVFALGAVPMDAIKYAVGLEQALGSGAPKPWPKGLGPAVCLAFIGTCAQATPLGYRDRVPARMRGPNTGCSTTASTRSLMVTPSSRSAAPPNPKILRTSGLVVFDIRGASGCAIPQPAARGPESPSISTLIRARTPVALTPDRFHHGHTQLGGQAARHRSRCLCGARYRLHVSSTTLADPSFQAQHQGAGLARLVASVTQTTKSGWVSPGRRRAEHRP